MLTTGKAFTAGLVEIQDEGSQLVALLLDAHPGMRVADYCAGAGGKTLAIAMRMNNRGHITACDVSAPRLAGAVRRLRRAGVHNVEQHLLVPGDKWDLDSTQKLVLADLDIDQIRLFRSHGAVNPITHCGVGPAEKVGSNLTPPWRKSAAGTRAVRKRLPPRARPTNGGACSAVCAAEYGRRF